MKYRIRVLTAVFCAGMAIGIAGGDLDGAVAEPSAGLVLWYDRPAAEWNEALPIGNGRMGAMVFGRVSHEYLQLNEDSIWHGRMVDRNNPDAIRHLARIRSLLSEGRVAEAEDLASLAMFSTPAGMRHYEPFADLHIIAPHLVNATDYRRELDLAHGIARTSFVANGVRHTREYFATAPDNVIAVRLTADAPGAITFRARLERQGRGTGNSHYLESSRRDGENGLIIAGTAGPGGVQFRGGLRIKTTGGSTRAVGDTVLVEGADEALVLVACATSFYHSDPGAALRAQLDRAFALRVDMLMARHVDDYRRLFDRVKLRLEGPAADDLPTDRRLARFASGGEDNGLVALFFQFGRYLLMSSSRPGTQPANLQGLWNPHWLPPWDSKYTININTQMNYWPAEVCNLAELHEPLFSLLERMREPGRRTARVLYGAGGFVAHHNTDLWGDTAPQDRYMPATIWPMGAAWLAIHLWEHYDFGRNVAFLRAAYPVMREACEFFFDYLVEDAGGRLVTGPSVSPENTYVLPGGESGRLVMGPSMDSQILDALLSHTLEAAETLDIDPEFRAKAADVRSRLAQPAIGRHGQLMEWIEDHEEAEPGHRHISHLWALHPGRSISPVTTPDLAQAARVTLERRLAGGGGHTGWSRAWIINLWARLHDGIRAGENVRALLAQSTLPNLLGTHPPFQIDGSFGGTAGIAEMLLQSHLGEIHLLPALPDDWPSGSVSGLRGRGGSEIGVSWQDGSLTSATIESRSGGTIRVRAGEMVREIQVQAGVLVRLGPDLLPAD